MCMVNCKLYGKNYPQEYFQKKNNDTLSIIKFSSRQSEIQGVYLSYHALFYEITLINCYLHEQISNTTLSFININFFLIVD